MMEQLGLDTRPEAYFDLVPWQVGGGHVCVLACWWRHVY